MTPVQHPGSLWAIAGKKLVEAAAMMPAVERTLVNNSTLTCKTFALTTTAPQSPERGGMSVNAAAICRQLPVQVAIAGLGFAMKMVEVERSNAGGVIRMLGYAITPLPGTPVPATSSTITFSVTFTERTIESAGPAPVAQLNDPDKDGRANFWAMVNPS